MHENSLELKIIVDKKSIDIKVFIIRIEYNQNRDQNSYFSFLRMI